MQAGIQKFLPCSFFMILPITFQTKLNIHLIGQEKLKVVKTKKLFITLEIKRRKDALWWLYTYLCILMVKIIKLWTKSQRSYITYGLMYWNAGNQTRLIVIDGSGMNEKYVEKQLVNIQDEWIDISEENIT